MKRLKGKVALVTGGSLGIGRATCLQLAREGAVVAVTDVLDDPGLEVVSMIEDEGGAADFWDLDVTVEDRVKKVMHDVVARYGHLDVLVNNAGIAGVSKPTHEVTEEEWDRVMAVNVKGVFLCTKHAVPHLRNSGGGSIVNLSSIYGIVSAPDVPPYHASKGAVRMMTKTDALLYALDNIRVNSVHPGFIWTPMVEGYLKSQGDIEAGRQALNALHPLGHVGTPEDIAHGIVFLASDESRFMTGAELVIDGGYTIR